MERVIGQYTSSVQQPAKIRYQKYCRRGCEKKDG
jgi:hypothetical protein